jgi:hypothetical protein
MLCTGIQQSWATLISWIQILLVLHGSVWSTVVKSWSW